MPDLTKRIRAAEGLAVEENASDGVVNAVTGSRFLEEILAMGGSRSALESFIAFRGREPELDALLRHNGMEIVCR